MKTLKSTIIAAMLPLAAIAQPTVTTSISIESKDVMSRGFVLSEDPFIKPQVMLSTKNGSYAYMNQKNNLAQGGADRGTYIAAGRTLAIPNGNLTVEVGQLSLPNGWKIPELYTATTFKLPLNPTVEAVVSGGDFPGNYFSLGGSKRKQLGDATLTLAGKVGYNDHYGTNFSGFSHATIDATVAVPVAKDVTASVGFRQLYGFKKSVPTDNAVSMKVTYKF